MVIITKKQTKPREKLDFYPTPYDLADNIVFEKVINYPNGRYPNKVLDPGCGNGIFGYAIKNNFTKSVVHGIDIERREWYLKDVNPYDSFKVGDYLDDDCRFFDNLGDYDLIIGNPPYALAEAFINRSRKLVKWNGKIIFLLKLAFLESKKRARGLYKEFKPTEVSVLAGRPSFDGSGKTNDYAFALFIWDMETINRGKQSGYSTIVTWFDWN